MPGHEMCECGVIGSAPAIANLVAQLLCLLGSNTDVVPLAPSQGLGFSCGSVCALLDAEGGKRCG